MCCIPRQKQRFLHCRVTATNNGNSESSELRFKILDADGNVLSTQAYKQALGAQVVTLTNGLTVARIPAGQVYTSDAFTLNVPAARNFRLMTFAEGHLP